MERIGFFSEHPLKQRKYVPQSPHGYRHLQDLSRLLSEYSGHCFPVSVRALSNPGLAIHGNHILIDHQVLNCSREVIAFVLAHEWGHQIHGDVAKYVGASQEFIAEREDAADAYAAKFLAFMEYGLDGVYDLNKHLNPETAAIRDIKIQKAYFEQLACQLSAEEHPIVVAA